MSGTILLGAALALVLLPRPASAQYHRQDPPNREPNPLADGCYRLMTPEFTPRYLTWNTSTDLFQLSSTPQPFLIRQLAGDKTVISTSSGEYLSSNVAQVLAGPGVWGPALLWDMNNGSSGSVFDQAAGKLSWSTVSSGAPGPLTVSPAGGTTENWTLEATTGCTPGGPIIPHPVVNLDRNTVPREGCVAIKDLNGHWAGIYFDPFLGYQNGVTNVFQAELGQTFYLQPTEVGETGLNSKYYIMTPLGDYVWADDTSQGPGLGVGVRHSGGASPNIDAMYQWEIQTGERGGGGGTHYADKFFIKNLFNNKYLSWNTINLAGEIRLTVQPNALSPFEQWIVERTTCIQPNDITPWDPPSYYLNVDYLPTDAMDVTTSMCRQASGIGPDGEPACRPDMKVQNQYNAGGAFSFIGFAPFYFPAWRTVVYGWKSGGSHGGPAHVYKDDADRCAYAHDLGYWEFGAYGPIGSTYGLYICISRIVPRTKQEARAKALGLNTLLALNPVPQDYIDNHYWELPRDEQLFAIGAGGGPRYEAGQLCPPVLDAADPRGWKSHPLCLPSQTSNPFLVLCPRMPGDANSDCLVNITDFNLVRAAYGGVGTRDDWRDANQDRTIDDLDLQMVIVNGHLTPLPNTNVVVNGTFASGLANWLTFSTPDPSYIVTTTAGGALGFKRVAPPPGTSNQAVVFQQTGKILGTDAPLSAQFDLGNDDVVRKRISVVLHDSDFSDVTFCTFWLAPNTPLATYGMVTHTTKPWANVTISFYAASTNAASDLGGFYRLDNVTLQFTPAQSPTGTHCIDPTTPAPPGGADGPNLLFNGTFGTGLSPFWGTFGQISGAVTGGVFEFIRPPGTPAGVVLQATGQPMTIDQRLTATFQLGNSSPVRKRVTVLVHDGDFSDLGACTFWLVPGQPLSAYTFLTRATKAWTNTTISFYPATVGSEQWIRLDNVTLKRTPAVLTGGTDCLEPGGVPYTSWSASGRTRATNTLGFATSPSGSVLPAEPTAAGGQLRDVSRTGTDEAWIADGFQRNSERSRVGAETSWIAVATGAKTHTLQRAEPLDLTARSGATLRVESWLSATASQASVQVSRDGVTWETVHVVAASDAWVSLEIDLAGYLGGVVSVRFAFDAVAPSDPFTQETWRIEGMAVHVVVRPA